MRQIYQHHALSDIAFKIITLILLFAPADMYGQSMRDELQAKVAEVSGPWLASGHTKEYNHLRDSHSKHFDAGGGLVAAYFSPVPIHFNVAGSWLDIDNRIRPNNEAEYYYSHPAANIENSVKTLFPSNFLEDALINRYNGIHFFEKIESIYWADAQGNEVGVLGLNSNSLTFDVKGNSITYSGFYPNLELTYSLSNTGRKFNLYVTSSDFFNTMPMGAAKLVIRERINSSEPFEVVSKREYLALLSGGEELFGYMKPKMLDADESNEFNVQPAEMMHYINNGELFIMSLFDVSWMTHSDRVYPLALDPIVDYFPTNITFWSGYQTGSTSKTTGILRITDGTTASWAKYNTSSLPSNATIVSAQYFGYHYTGSGNTTIKFCRLRHLTTDPVPAAAATLWNESLNGTIVSTDFNWAFSSNYEWKNVMLNTAGVTAVQNSVGQGWYALGHQYASGGTSFAYHYGHDGLAGLITYLRLDYNTGPPDPTVTASANPLCGVSSTTLIAQGGAGTIHWYTGSCGGSLIGTGDTLTVFPTQATTYFARSFDNGQFSAQCGNIDITIGPNVNPPIGTGVTVNCGAPISLSASGSPMGYRWYSDPLAQNLVDTGSVITIGNQFTTDTFYVAAVQSFGPPPAVYTFTNAGAVGRVGPTQSQVNSAYTGTPLAGQVTITGSGIQNWTVPTTGTYTIEAWGAQGSNATATTGGLGAYMSGEFQLTQGEVIRILVGQNAPPSASRINTSSPGGGGTFITRSPHNNTNSILLVAGGGGGTGNERPNTSNATTANNGLAGSHGTGGTNGNGGTSGISTAGAGAGFFTDGQGGGGAGVSYVNGGLGGPINTTYSPQGGGFGGGGSITSGANSRYGGGGGYGGGAGSSSQSGITTGMWGGGGGSFNSGANQVNQGGVRLGQGEVRISISGGVLCQSALVPVVATVNPISAPSYTGDTLLCSPGTALLQLSGGSGALEWYQDPALTMLLDTGAVFQTGALSGDTNFYVRAALITTALDSFSFSTAGATGNTGPSQSQINSAYSGTNLDGIVTSQNGIQLWTAPVTGTYRIKAAGGQGFGPFGGRGAEMEGDFQITAGTQLKILVGQQAGPPISSSNQYGGGGGSFVTLTDNTPLVIAGGGGGSWDQSSFHPNSDGKTTNSGSDGINGTTNATGGTNGNGGNSGNSADGGAGLTGNGNGSAGGQSFINGGNGGIDRGQGGFGGGGGTSSWDNRRSGGGGGYSGGGGSAAGSSTTGNPVGGGGGSFNSGSNQANNTGVNTGDGYVTISYNVPGVACYSNVIQVPVRIGQTPSIPNILAITPISVCQGDSVVIQSDAGPATIWSDGQTGGVATFTSQQQVTAQRTDSLGCLSAQSVSIPVTVNPKPIINSLLTQGVCEGFPIQLIVQSTVSSINGATISQQIADMGDGNQINVVNTISNHTYFSPGNYTIDLTATSNHGCFVQDSVNLTIYPTPQIQPLQTFPLCLSDTLQLNPSISLGSFGNTSVSSFAWNFGDGSTSNQQNANHIYATSGSFPITFSSISDQGCSAQVQTIVTVNPKPGLISLNAPPVCENVATQITLNINPGGAPLQSISWILGDGNSLTQQSAQLAHLYSSPGSYLVGVTATDSNGCSENIQTNAVVNPKPQIQSISAPPVCSGTLSSLSAQASISSVNNSNIQQYNWILGDGNFAQGSFITHNYAQEGAYNVSLIVVSNQSCSDTSLLQVFVNPLPQVQGLSSLSACLNSVLTLNPAIQIAPINNAQIASGLWNMGDGTQLSGVNANHAYLQVGTFPVSFTVTSNHGCVATVQGSATIHPKPQITSANASSVCYGNASQFIQTSTVPGVGPSPITSVLWYFGDGNQSGVASPSYLYNSAGIYTASVVVTTDQGCTDSTQIQAIVNSLPDISLSSPIQACENGLVNFMPSISVAPVNNASLFQTVWNFGDGNQAQGNNVNHSYVNAGTYTATVTASTQYGCSETASTTVNVFPSPVANPIFDQHCIGETVPYNANAGISSGSISSYNWNFGDGVGVSNQIQGEYSYSNPGTYMVTLTLTSDAACTTSVTVPVFIETIPVSDFSASLLQPFQVQFVPDFVGPMATHSWDFGDGNSSTQALPMHTYSGPGQYTVCLTASNGVCSTETCQPIQLNTTGVIEQGHGGIASLTLYPNPFIQSSELTLELKESGSVQIYITDMAGRTLYSKKENATAGEWRFILNQSELNLSTGVYLLNISTNSTHQSLKLIKAGE